MLFIKENIEKICLILFLLLVLIRGFFYCLYLPPWSAPDELSHIGYILYIVNTKSLPSQYISQTSMESIEKSSARQRNILLSIQQGKITPKHADLFSRAMFSNAPIAGTIIGNPPMYYLYEVMFYNMSQKLSSYWSLVFLRFGSVILEIGSLFVIYKISKLFFITSKILPFFITILVGLEPMFTFIGSAVNNDAMVIFAFALFVYLTVSLILLPKRVSTKNIMLVGVIAGTATLVKPQLMMLIFLYWFSLILKKNLESKTKWLNSFICLIVPISYYFPRFLQGGISAFAYPTSHAHLQQTPFWQYPLAFLLNKQPIGIFMTFWGMLGSLDVLLPKWVYVLFLLAICISLVGWSYGFKKKQIHVMFSILKKEWIFMYVSGFVYIAAIFFFDIFYFTKTDNFAIQGRYFLPVLYIVVIFLIQGLLNFSMRVTKIFLLFFLVTFLIAQVITYTAISKYYFHSYSVISPLSKIYL